MAQSLQCLEIVALLDGGVCMPYAPVMLDGLLASVVARRRGLVALSPESMVQIDVPIARSECGRFNLCSEAHGAVETYASQYTNRRPPIEQFQSLASDKMRRCDITAGINKGYRIPRALAYYAEDRLTWWCIGDESAIVDLLGDVCHIGKKRSVGLGRVRSWDVRRCDEWDGFPIMRDGKPLRPLPVDYPGLLDPKLGMRTLLYPYWDHTKEELLAVP